MSVKKLLVLAAAGVVSATAFAGGSNQFAMAQSKAPVADSSMFNPAAYVDVNAGMDWSGFSDQTSGSKFKSMSGNPLSFGGDVGYVFMKNLGVELGGSYLMNIQQTAPTAFTLSQWDIYGALKTIANLMPNLDLFAKFGMDYLSVKNNAAGMGTTGNFAPTFGAGLDWSFTQNWRASLQWRRLSSITDSSKTAKVSTVPAQDLFTVGVGYVFPMGD